MKRFIPTSLVFFLISVSLFATPPVLVRTSHNGPVSTMEYAPSTQILFTGGNDGFVKVWDVSDERLLETIQVDRDPVRRIALYPDGERIAVLSGTEKNNRISVWNWREGTQEFIRTINNEIILFDVSPQGSYLYFSVPELRSLRFLDGAGGRELPFMRISTGIVIWGTISKSEERVLVYVPADGTLTYYNIVTGEIAGRFSAPSGLREIHLLAQRRYAAAINETGFLTVIDLLSGDTPAEIAAGEIESLQFDGESEDILVLSTDFSGVRSWRRYTFNQDGLRRSYTLRRSIPEGIVTFLPVGREIIAGYESGSILRWLPYDNSPTVMTVDHLIPVEDIALSQNRLHLLTAQGVLTISSDGLGMSSDTIDQTSYVRERLTPVDAHAGARLIERDGMNMFIWTPSNQEEQLYRYRFYGAALPLGYELPGTLRYVGATEDHLLVITRTGVLQVYDSEGSLIYDYRGIGLLAAIETNRGIIAGQTTQGVLGSSILRLSPETGETVPIESRSKLVFELVYDQQRGRLFTLGVRESTRNEVSTVLEMHSGINFDSSRIILEVPGEHLDASLIIDSISGDIYTTLDDRGGILKWDGLRVSDMVRNPSHIPNRMKLQGNFLFTANTDGTVSIYDVHERSLVFDLTIQDLRQRIGWIATSRDGGYFTNEEILTTSEYLSKDDRAVRLMLRNGDEGQR